MIQNKTAKKKYLVQKRNADYLLRASMAAEIIRNNFSGMSFANKSRLHKKTTNDLKGRV